MLGIIDAQRVTPALELLEVLRLVGDRLRGDGAGETQRCFDLTLVALSPGVAPSQLSAMSIASQRLGDVRGCCLGWQHAGARSVGLLWGGYFRDLNFLGRSATLSLADRSKVASRPYPAGRECRLSDV